MDVDAFLQQAREYDAGEDARDGLIKLMSLMGRTHPQAVVRLAELDRWAASGEYSRILAGDYPRRSGDRDASVSQEVRNAAKSYQESWNRTSDPLISTLRDIVGGVGDAGGKLFDNITNRMRRPSDSE
jgi:hypothetical protein